MRAARRRRRPCCCRSPTRRCRRSISPAARIVVVRCRARPRRGRVRPSHVARHRPHASFPEMFPGPLGVSLAGKALAAGIWSLDARRHPRARHRQAPHRRRHAGRRRPRHGDEGRRAGARASTRVAGRRPRPRLLMSPRGVPLTQARVAALARGPGAVILCGRFEGVDERVIEARELRGSLDRRLRAVGRRDRGAGADRRLRAAPARRHGQGGLRRRGELRRRAAGIPAIHPAAGVRGPRHPGGADLAATTPRSRPGGGPRPSGSPASAGRTSGRPTGTAQKTPR